MGNLRQRLRLMLRPTTLFMATTLHGTVPATTVMASSMARGAPVRSLSLRLMLMLRLRLRLTMAFMATILLDMLPTHMSTCMARGVLNPPLMLTLTYMAMGMAMPTGPTMATTTANRGVENRNRMLCLDALN